MKDRSWTTEEERGSLARIRFGMLVEPHSEKPGGEGRKPFVNAANKTAYYFAEGMSDEEAYQALLDPACHTQTHETHEHSTGEIYRVVRVSIPKSS